MEVTQVPTAEVCSASTSGRGRSTNVTGDDGGPFDQVLAAVANQQSSAGPEKGARSSKPAASSEDASDSAGSEVVEAGDGAETDQVVSTDGMILWAQAAAQSGTALASMAGSSNGQSLDGKSAAAAGGDAAILAVGEAGQGGEGIQSSLGANGGPTDRGNQGSLAGDSAGSTPMEAVTNSTPQANSTATGPSQSSDDAVGASQEIAELGGIPNAASTSEADSPAAATPAMPSGAALGSKQAETEPAAQALPASSSSGPSIAGSTPKIETERTRVNAPTEQVGDEYAPAGSISAAGSVDQGAVADEALPLQQAQQSSSGSSVPRAGAAMPEVAGGLNAESSDAVSEQTVGQILGASTANAIGGGDGVAETGAALKGEEAPRANRQEVMDQLLASADKLNSTTNSRMRIQLKPAELGYIDLRLQVKDGVLSLNISADSSKTRDLIESGLPMLREGLAQKSIQVAQVSLSLTGGYDGAGSFNSSTGFSGLAGGWAGAGRQGASSSPRGLAENGEITVIEELSGTSGQTSGDGRHSVDYRV